MKRNHQITASAMALCLFILSGLRLNAQIVRCPMPLANNSYNQLLMDMGGEPGSALLTELAINRLLPIQRFNMSYSRGIGQFQQFKNKFHYAPFASDIREEETPLDYLLGVISKYQSSGKYRVAILYYDAVDANPDKELEPLREEFSFAPLPADIEENPDADLEKKVRVWYLSDQNLVSRTSAYNYSDLEQLEIQFKRSISANSIGSSRAPRSAGAQSYPDEWQDSSVTATAPGIVSSVLLPSEIRSFLATDSINGVIVIPYRNIGQIPFYALPLDKNNGMTSYFVERYAYTIAPHLCNYNKVFGVNASKIGKSNNLNSKTPLIIGNPQFKSTEKLYLPELPGAETEAKIVADFFKTKAYTGKMANYDTVLNRIKKADMVWFATHAVPSFSDPANQSFLALTPSASKPDGYLNILKIQGSLKGKTKLAVLSSCQTGVGKSYKSGYCNIGRGFFIGGVDNTLMSLWNLDDKNTAAFMITVAAELQKPQYFYPAENLRQAILNYKSEGTLPSEWASMVNFGICY